MPAKICFNSYNMYAQKSLRHTFACYHCYLFPTIKKLFWNPALEQFPRRYKAI